MPLKNCISNAKPPVKTPKPHMVKFLFMLYLKVAISHFHVGLTVAIIVVGVSTCIYITYYWKKKPSTLLEENGV